MGQDCDIGVREQMMVLRLPVRRRRCPVSTQAVNGPGQKKPVWGYYIQLENKGSLNGKDIRDWLRAIFLESLIVIALCGNLALLFNSGKHFVWVAQDAWAESVLAVHT